MWSKLLFSIIMMIAERALVDTDKDGFPDLFDKYPNDPQKH